jgi:Helix-turn-helix domain
MTNNRPMNQFEWSKLYFRNADPKLPTRVMAVLATYANFDSLECFPSLNQLEKDTGLNRTTIIRQINKNVDAGWLEKVNRGNSSGWCTTYKLTTPRSCTDAPTSRIPSCTDATRVVAQTPPPSRVRAQGSCTDATPTTHRTTHGSTQRSMKRTTDPKGSTAADQKTSAAVSTHRAVASAAASATAPAPVAIEGKGEANYSFDPFSSPVGKSSHPSVASVSAKASTSATDDPGSVDDPFSTAFVPGHLRSM